MALGTQQEAPTGRRRMQFGDEAYLWLLVAIEVLTLLALRASFGRRHGG